MDPTIFNIKEIGIVGAVLVLANQALRVVATVLKERYEEKRSPGSGAHMRSGCAFDPELGARVKRIDESVLIMMDGVNRGSFACKWSSPAEVGDHIRDAKETLQTVRKSHDG